MDIANAIAAWGSWGQITEASQSSPNGTEILNDTANLLLNPLQSAPVSLNPYQLTLKPGNLGPFTISLAFLKVCRPDPPICLCNRWLLQQVIGQIVS